jgi:PKD repeat protein
MIIMSTTTIHQNGGILRVLLYCIAALLCMSAIALPAMAATAAFTATPVSGTAPLSVQFTDASTGSAAERVMNGGLESGDATGWTLTGTDDYSATVTSQTLGTTAPHTGSYMLYIAAGQAEEGTVSASQAIDLTSVQNITFWSMSGVGSVHVKIDSTDVITDIYDYSWTQHTIDTSSYTGTHTLTFYTPETVHNMDLLIDDVTAIGTNGVTAWRWDFGDYNSSIVQNPSHSYTSTGTYTVALTATDASGSNTATQADLIAVSPGVSAPVAGFAADTVSGTAPLTVTFTDQSSNTPTSWAWDFDNNGIIDNTTQSPSYTFTASGTYTVNLTAINAGGSDSEVKEGYVTVSSGVAPVSAFSGTPTSGTAPLTVAFTDASTGDPAAWAWDFDNDGTIDNTTQNPSYTYTAGGTYTVNLTVTNADGSGSETKTAYISAYQDNGPVWTANSGWNAPDIGTYAGPAFADLDGDGDSDMMIGQYYNKVYGYQNIGSAGNPVWTANSSWDVTIGRGRPGLVDLDNDGDMDMLFGKNDGITYGYENTGSASKPVWTARSDWNLPDIGNNAGPAAADLDNDGDYDLLVGGSYNAILYAFENTGSASSPVWTAKSAWDISYESAGRLYPCFGDLDDDGDMDLLIGRNNVAYTFENTGSANNPAWTAKSTWNSPAAGSSMAAPALTDLDGDGDPDLMIGTMDGISYAYKNTIDLLPVITPVANFTATPTSGNAPETVKFKDTSRNHPTSWYWDFGDGTTSTLKKPSHVYTDTGTYTVTLTVTNAAGSDTGTKAGYVTIATAIQPVAGFTATPISGTAPVTVQFTDTSTGSILIYEWDFNNDGTVDSRIKNPAYTYTSAGKYTVNHTVSGYGFLSSSVQTDLITMLGTPDLAGNLSSTFTPYYPNTVTATISNIGNGDAATSRVLISVDGNITSADVAALVAGSSMTVSITDPLWRKVGQSVPVTITVDSENTIVESNETNNMYSTSAAVARSGSYYNGGRYYSGHDIETGNYTEGHVAVISALGSGYQTGGGWYSTTAQWTAESLPVPTDAAIRAARLYQSYTWSDNGNPNFTVQFNGNTVEQAAFYGDGTADNTNVDDYNGQAIYDVTPYFSKAGNTAIITAEAPKGGLYGAVLVVVYEDTSEPYRKIWLDDGSDSLNAATTGYAMFGNVTTTKVSSAKMTTILPSGADNAQGSILFNGQTAALKGTGGSDPGYKYYEVTSALQDGTNELGIVCDGYMNLATAILELTYEAPPATSFSTNTTSGTAPVAVQFTDTSYGTTGWQWDFNGDNVIDSTVENPVYTYTSAGTYTVNLTATNAYGSATETKTGYITITTPTGGAPVAAFSTSATNGLAPVSASFTDQSTNTPTGWLWEYRLADTGTWTTFSTEKNPGFDFTTAGTYDVRLTATNAEGSGIVTKTHVLAAATEHDYLATIASGTVSGNLFVDSVSPWGDMGGSTHTLSYTLPASGSNIAWARVFVNDYSGSGTNNYPVLVTTEFDADGDGTFETVLGAETCDIMSGTNEYAYPVNDHVTKVYSDYEAWYDVTSLITTTTPKVRVTAANVPGQTLYDGRIKSVTLVVAYNDDDTDQVKYWVNHGNDWMTGSSSTGFDTSALSSGWTSAEIHDVAFSSADASYTLNNGSITNTLLGTGAYYKYNSFDVAGSLLAGAANTFGYTNTGPSFKTCLATLAVKYTGTTTTAPVAAFSGTPTSGVSPLTVTFTDTSTNTPTSWSWDFGDSDTTNATEQNPVHTYIAAGTYNVTLTATNAGGSDSGTMTDYITVSTGVVTLPDQTNLPTDPDNDGIYEDLNGNGRKDYNDLQLFFSNLVWIANNEPIAPFDFNGNGRIDFNDLQVLYGEMV